MRTKARRVLVLLFDEVELYDVAAPVEILSTAGRHWNFRPYKIEMIAERAGSIVTRNQIRLEASQALAHAEPAEVLLVPGGFGARRFAESPSCLAEVSRLAQQAELIGCVGNGALVLERANLLPQAAAPTATDGSLTQPAPRRGIVEHERALQALATGDALDLGLAMVRRTLGDKLVTWIRAELGLETRERLEIRY